jgi:hypothetical protein
MYVVMNSCAGVGSRVDVVDALLTHTKIGRVRVAWFRACGFFCGDTGVYQLTFCGFVKIQY